MYFEEVLPRMREGKVIKSRSAEFGLKFHFETFGCVDSNDQMLIAQVDDSGEVVSYTQLTAVDILKEDYEVIE